MCFWVSLVGKAAIQDTGSLQRPSAATYLVERAKGPAGCRALCRSRSRQLEPSRAAENTPWTLPPPIPPGSESRASKKLAVRAPCVSATGSQRGSGGNRRAASVRDGGRTGVLSLRQRLRIGLDSGPCRCLHWLEAGSRPLRVPIPTLWASREDVQIRAHGCVCVRVHGSATRCFELKREVLTLTHYQIRKTNQKRNRIMDPQQRRRSGPDSPWI